MSMVEVECPIDGCEYEGPVRSVMNHITASAQEGHKGEHGQNYMEQVRERAEGLLNNPAGQGTEQEAEPAGEAGEQGGEPAEQEVESVGETGEQEAEQEAEPVEEAGEQETEQDGDPAEQGGRGAVAPGAAAAGPALLAGLFGTGEGGSVNWTVLVAVAVLALLLFSLNSGESGGDSEPEDSEPVEELDEQPQAGGGLRGA